MKGLGCEELSEAPLLVNGLLQRILRTAREYLHMEVAFISEFTGGRRVFRLVDCDLMTQHILTVDGSDPLEESYCQRVVDGRLPQRMQNAMDIPEARSLPVTNELPVGAHLSVPLLLEDGTIYGTFCCFSRDQDYALTDHDLNVMRAYADLASTLLGHLFSEDLQRLSRRRHIESTIEKQDFYSVYQGIYRIRDMSIVGYEALTRFNSSSSWNTEVWFAEAAQVGMACELETAAAKKALACMDRLEPKQFLSINISPEALLLNSNLDFLQEHDMSSLVLEITEHEEIRDYSSVAKVLAPLRERGLRLAVDDAGAGYASLRHILQLRPDIIKLDRSLIQNLDQDDTEFFLATALASFARSTGAEIIAEGVETEGELQALKELDVDLAQGYLLARPAPFVNA